MRPMFLILAVSILLVCWSLIRRDRKATSKFSLDDLLIDDQTQKTSLARLVMAGAFLFSMWLMALLAVRDKMTEGYFTIFCGAWVAPIVTKIVAERMPRKEGDGS